MKLLNLHASVMDVDGKPVAYIYATLADGSIVEIEITESSVRDNTINIEIDGDFTTDDPSVKIQLNDTTVYDSLEADD